MDRITTANTYGYQQMQNAHRTQTATSTGFFSTLSSIQKNNRAVAPAERGSSQSVLPVDSMGYASNFDHSNMYVKGLAYLAPKIALQDLATTEELEEGRYYSGFYLMIDALIPDASDEMKNEMLSVLREELLPPGAPPDAHIKSLVGSDILNTLDSVLLNAAIAKYGLNAGFHMDHSQLVAEFITGDGFSDDDYRTLSTQLLGDKSLYTDPTIHAQFDILNKLLQSIFERMSAYKAKDGAVEAMGTQSQQ